jgi:hypothetical protein
MPQKWPFMPTKNRSIYQCSDTHCVHVEATVIPVPHNSRSYLSKSNYRITKMEIYSVTTQKTMIFIATAVITLYLTS